MFASDHGGSVISCPSQDTFESESKDALGHTRTTATKRDCPGQNGVVVTQPGEPPSEVLLTQVLCPLGAAAHTPSRLRSSEMPPPRSVFWGPTAPPPEGPLRPGRPFRPPSPGAPRAVRECAHRPAGGRPGVPGHKTLREEILSPASGSLGLRTCGWAANRGKACSGPALSHILLGGPAQHLDNGKKLGFIILKTSAEMTTERGPFAIPLHENSNNDQWVSLLASSVKPWPGYSKGSQRPCPWAAAEEELSWATLTTDSG